MWGFPGWWWVVGFGVPSTTMISDKGLDHVQTDPDYNFKNLVFNETDINDSTP